MQTKEQLVGVLVAQSCNNYIRQAIKQFVGVFKLNIVTRLIIGIGRILVKMSILVVQDAEKEFTDDAIPVIRIDITR